jgi:hypothetical protein
MDVVIRLECGHTRHETPPIREGQDTFCRECVATRRVEKVSR